MACKIDYSWYPFDTQVCPLIIFPASMMYYGMGGIKLHWDKHSPSLDELFFPGKRTAEPNWDKWMTVERNEKYNKSDYSYLRVNFWFQVSYVLQPDKF